MGARVPIINPALWGFGIPYFATGALARLATPGNWAAWIAILVVTLATRPTIFIIPGARRPCAEHLTAP
jgi:hypothetical protein